MSIAERLSIFAAIFGAVALLVTYPLRGIERFGAAMMFWLLLMGWASIGIGAFK